VVRMSGYVRGCFSVRIAAILGRPGRAIGLPGQLTVCRPCSGGETIPPIAWIPLAILWFGIGEDSKSVWPSSRLI
jgi:hypothetical protein